MLSDAVAVDVEAQARRGRWQLGAVVLAAFLIRCLLFWSRGDYLDWDEALYLLMARNLASGAGISLNGYPHIALSPFVPYCTALFSELSGITLLAAQRLLASLAGALLVIPVWYLLRLDAGERVALIGASLVAGWTVLIDVGPRFGPMWDLVYAGSEPFYLAALFGAFALGELGLRRSGSRRLLAWSVAGVSLALAYLARPEAVVIGGLYALIRLMQFWIGSRKEKILPGLAAAGLAFLLVAAPHLVRLHRLSGEWTLSDNLGPTGATSELYQEIVRDDSKIGPYLRVWWGLEPGHERLLNPYWGVDESRSSSQRLADYRTALARVWTPGSTGARWLLERVIAYLLALWTLTLPLFLPLALLGVAWRGGVPGARFPAFVLAVIVGSVLISLRVYVVPRFLLILVPALALWASRGLVLAAGSQRWLPAAVVERATVALLVVAGVGLAAARTFGSEAKAARAVGSRDRAAAERLAEVIPAERPVMSWHPRLAYWGGWDWRALPVASLENVAHYAAHRGVTTLFLARGSYSPLELTADYVVITIDPALAAAYRAFETGEADHPHPPAKLLPGESIAGFPTGSISLNSGDEDNDDGER